MSAQEEDAILVLRKGRDLLEQQLNANPDPARWPERLAHTLRALWPDARLCYGRIGAAAACALDDTGAGNAAWASALEVPLAGWLATPNADAPETLPAPPALGFAGPIHIARLRGAGAVPGAAAVAFPARFSPEEVLWAVEVLDEWAAVAGLRFGLEESRARIGFLLQERDQQTALCALADMVGPFSHEMQNVFNNIVLQAAIVTRDVPEEVRGDIDVMRRMGLQASSMTSQLDDYRYRIAVVRRAVDLNAVVTSVLAELPAHPVKVERVLAADLPAVSANESDLCRLLRLLVVNARSVLEVHGGGTVTVRTAPRDGKVLLAVEDTGPGLEGEEDPARVFEPFLRGRPGENNLELSACLGIVRRLKATIRAESPGASGLIVTAELDEAERTPFGERGQS